MNDIMISYRREDSADVTGRLYDRLVQAFGRNTVFKDVDSVPLGANFRAHLRAVVSRCRALVVVIGRNWLSCTDAAGRRRLDDPQDVVRLEIEAALERRIPVVPLLVQGATMPGEAALPGALKELASCNGTVIGHDPQFESDVDRLVRNLAAISGVPVPDRVPGRRAKRWGEVSMAAALSAGLALATSCTFYLILNEPLTARESLVVMAVLLPFAWAGQRIWAKSRRVEERR